MALSGWVIRCLRCGLEETVGPDPHAAGGAAKNMAMHVANDHTSEGVDKKDKPGEWYGRAMRYVSWYPITETRSVPAWYGGVRGNPVAEE